MPPHALCCPVFSLQGVYRAFSSNAKFVNAASMPQINFMAAAVVEMYGINAGEWVGPPRESPGGEQDGFCFPICQLCSLWHAWLVCNPMLLEASPLAPLCPPHMQPRLTSTPSASFASWRCSCARR